MKRRSLEDGSRAKSREKHEGGKKSGVKSSGEGQRG